MAERFDLVVIGSGPAGEKGAAQAAYHGKKVAIVERSRYVGGAAVGNAGIPTKTLREAALYLTGFRRRQLYGVGLELEPADLVAHLRARTERVVETASAAVLANIERHGIALFHGPARLASPRRVVVDSDEGTLELDAGVVLIATGSRPSHPPNVPFDHARVLDSEDLLRIEGPVGDLVVIGGSAVGVEYASIFAAAGARVTLIDRNDRLVRFCDAEISDHLADALRGLGMRIVLGGGKRPTIVNDDDGVEVRLASGEVLRPELIFYSAGRAGNTEDLGLEDVGIAVDRKGRIVVDDTYATNVDGVYAAGDVIGQPSLASVSMEQARVAVCHAFGIPFKDTVDPLAPLGVYSIPEVAMVGLKEEDARVRGVDHEVGRAWFRNSIRATIAGATEGLIKLVFERGTRKLVGVHIVSDDASELVHIGQMAIQLGAPIDHFIHATFNVPTRSDLYKYAAYDGLARVGL